MSSLHLPKRITIRVLTWSWTPSGAAQDLPYAGPPLALGIQTFARRRNDYHLGPFFSDSDGLVTITGEQLESSVRAHLDWGLMDHADVRESFAFIEITHWSEAEIERAIHVRESGVFSEHEARLWGSLEQYLHLLRSSANRRLRPPAPGAGQRVRDEWDGSRSIYEYSYRVHPSALA